MTAPRYQLVLQLYVFVAMHLIDSQQLEGTQMKNISNIVDIGF